VSRLKEQIYIVDADSWIKCYEETYPIDVFPGLWDLIREAALDEMIITPRQAINETGDGSKGVSAWVRTIQPSIVLNETPKVVDRMNEVVKQFSDLTRGIAESADPWLVAHARGRSNAVVVTEEKRSLGGRKKLPDVCEAFGVKSIDVLTMFRRLSFKLK
jgi:hypothetical protein